MNNASFFDAGTKLIKKQPEGRFEEGPGYYMPVTVSLDQYTEGMEVPFSVTVTATEQTFGPYEGSYGSISFPLKVASADGLWDLNCLMFGMSLTVTVGEDTFELELPALDGGGPGGFLLIRPLWQGEGAADL